MAAGIRPVPEARILHLDVNNNGFVYRGRPDYWLDERSNSSLKYLPTSEQLSLVISFTGE
jgi:hypothetical protein